MKGLSYLPAFIFTLFYGTIIILGDIQHVVFALSCGRFSFKGTSLWQFIRFNGRIGFDNDGRKRNWSNH
ncbi:MAG: hypothetical protein E7192_07230 [Erysipelotrichaceae bacterium]|nr:hypothetical protein [Erysipelotrichaceae bacterium]